jgi:hypothetical protein
MNDRKVLDDTLKRYGFELERQNRHKVFKHPSGHIHVMPCTPSSQNSSKASLAALRRLIRSKRLLEVPKRKTREPEIDIFQQNNVVITAQQPQPQTQPVHSEQDRQELHSQPEMNPQPLRPRPKIKLVGIREAGAILNQMTVCWLEPYQIRADIRTDHDHAWLDIESAWDFAKGIKVDLDPAQRAANDFNIKVNRVAFSAAARFENSIRDMRKGNRVKKSRVWQGIYESAGRIFQEDLFLEYAGMSVEFVAGGLTERCMKIWHLVWLLQSAVTFELRDGKVSVTYLPKNEEIKC